MAFTELEKNILDLRATIADLETRVVLCDRALDPVRRQKAEIEASIRLTHFPRLFNPDRALERVPLFWRLTSIAIEHGPAFNERKELHQRSKAYQRELQRIEREIERLKGRKAKPESAQGSMRFT